MWITKQLFEDLVKERAEAVGRESATTSANIRLQATLDWTILRLNQLEHERAVMIGRFLGIHTTAPEIKVEVPTESTVDAMLRDPGTLFKDMGDEEAVRQGISWDPEGAVAYTRK